MAISINSSDLLTKEQLDHHFKVYAGPGAGKTHFLVENIKNIVSHHYKISKSRNRKVLCITYTNAAVNEIKRRLENYSKSVLIYTIHGFIIEHIIKPYQADLHTHIKHDFDFDIPEKCVLTSQVEGMGILHGHEREDIYSFINNECGTEDELSYSKKLMGDVEVDLSLFIAEGATKIKHSRSLSDKHIMAIKKYIWTKAKKLTHDEILYFGYKILVSNPTIVYALRVQFPFVFVDEFQDTNPVQAMLIKYLGQKSTIIGVIGDIAQSIYSFQGAKPSEFANFQVDAQKPITEYEIPGNRRSTKNIIGICNFIRQSDSLEQVGIREYTDDTEKDKIESIKCIFMFSQSESISSVVKEVIDDGGAILTRGWADAFEFMQDVVPEQKKLLKQIYNSYFNSPIDIRSEIAEHNNVTWVRAFTFIFRLWEGYKSGSLLDIIKAILMYYDIKTIKRNKQLRPQNIIGLNKTLSKVFSKISESSYVVCIIRQLEEICKQEENKAIIQAYTSAEEFVIPLFDEQEREDLVEKISALNWATAYKLFKEVFSENSKYMTVHQAKGLEWDSVLVSVKPNRFDKVDFSDMFANPHILNESSADEFARIFYVACSRAKNRLFIHIDNPNLKELIQQKIEEYSQKHNYPLEYEIL